MSLKLLFKPHWYFRSDRTQEELLAVVQRLITSGERGAMPEVYEGEINGDRFHITKRVESAKGPQQEHVAAGRILREGDGSVIIADTGYGISLIILGTLCFVMLILFTANTSVSFRINKQPATREDALGLFSLISCFILVVLSVMRVDRRNSTKNFVEKHLSAKEVDGKFVLPQADHA